MNQNSKQLKSSIFNLSVWGLALALASSSFASGGKPPAPSEPAGPDLSKLGAGGTGCAGLATVRTVGGSSKVGLEFLDFETATSGESTLARENCSLALPAQIPAGWQLVIDEVTVKGTARLRPDHRATVRLDLFVAGTRGPSVSEDFVTSGPFELTLTAANAAGEDKVATECGPTDVNLRANLSLRITGAGSSAVVQSLGDGDDQGVIGFKWRRCP